jgi:PAS domain S-box-containing protein/putative nucleotidyltransferase with HDIG domain
MDLKLSPSYFLVQGIKYFFISLLIVVVLQIIIFAIINVFIPGIFSGISTGSLLPVILIPLAVILVLSILMAWYLTRISARRKLQQDTLTIYSKIVNSSSEAVIMHDLNGRCFYSNEKALTALGLDKRELTDISFDSLLQSEYQEVFKEQIKRMEKNDEINYEALLLRKDKSELPAEIICHSVKLNGRKYILNIIKDVTERKQRAEELKLSASKLKNAMEGTINTLALAAEVRDPYTAGHQQRVSLLSVAIANEMGLPEEQKEGIRVGSSLHDIGKIYVPAEILSKPGRLKVNEFNLVRDHAEVGYELLKAIEFPWPVAEMILQHHERYNGSGYPRGLSGDSIMLESSIIAVSDVVESMASHRPYRPAFNIEKALLEILQNKGTLYHPDVVDCCLRLFNEKGFTF